MLSAMKIFNLDFMIMKQTITEYRVATAKAIKNKLKYVLTYKTVIFIAEKTYSMLDSKYDSHW